MFSVCSFFICNTHIGINQNLQKNKTKTRKKALPSSQVISASSQGLICYSC